MYYRPNTAVWSMEIEVMMEWVAAMVMHLWEDHQFLNLRFAPGTSTPIHWILVGLLEVLLSWCCCCPVYAA